MTALFIQPVDNGSAFIVTDKQTVPFSGKLEAS